MAMPQCSVERQVVMMCWQAHWLFLNQIFSPRQGEHTHWVCSQWKCEEIPIIPWMPLKMMKTGVVHAGPADDVCRIIWMAWNKKGERQRVLSLHPDHLEFIDPECSPAPLHSNNLFSSLLLHNRLSTGVLPYSTTLHNCFPKKWLTIWFRAGHTWYLSISVHHRII